ncbi:MAG: exodeoxyribonuclease VII large subunit [Lentisphaerae bacterium]|nr:exodeoxyribonuclease VII large subunit [Lentisphaerota bacterium]
MAERIYGVSELTQLIKGALEKAFGSLWVEGEISNLRRPASGHIYFTLKDATAQLSAVLFRGNRRGATCDPMDGAQVRVYGEITVYERGGNYQILVRRMEAAGQGALQAQFEALKQKLLDEGLFDAARKRPIPVLPQHVGVVTSATGAAIRDILNVVSRRFPNLHIVLAPVQVQGAGAAEAIAGAIADLNALGGLDVMIVGRGGGSLEDLWAFNEERVARAIAASAVPVISAVGHEIDYTISDFVADLRAPTPSAAAELVVARKDALQARIGMLGGRLAGALREGVWRSRQRLRQSAASYVFREPGNLARRYRERLDGFGVRAARAAEGRFREGQQRADELAGRLGRGMLRGLAERGQDLKRLNAQLKALSPLAVLERGYSVTRRADGTVIRDADGVKAGERVTTRVRSGSFDSEVVT